MIRLLRSPLITLASAMVIFGTLGVVAWAFMSIVTVTIRNDTGEVASNVAIGFTGKTLWRGDLLPSQSQWAFGIPQQDGALEVSYEIAGRRYEIECGYVTDGPLGGRYKVIVRSGGKHECGNE